MGPSWGGARGPQDHGGKRTAVRWDAYTQTGRREPGRSGRRGTQLVGPVPDRRGPNRWGDVDRSSTPCMQGTRVVGAGAGCTRRHAAWRAIDNVDPRPIARRPLRDAHRSVPACCRPLSCYVGGVQQSEHGEGHRPACWPGLGSLRAALDPDLPRTVVSLRTCRSATAGSRSRS